MDNQPSSRHLEEMEEKLWTVLENLRQKTHSQRVTLRADYSPLGLTVDHVLSEAREPTVRSLKPDTSLRQRELNTVRYLEKTKAILVQPDCLTADVSPPAALMQVYGVKSQMLSPLVAENDVMGWISVHDTNGIHYWTPEEITELVQATEKVAAILHAYGVL